MAPIDQKVASGGASSFTIAAATSISGDVAVLFVSMFSASSHAVTSVTDANGNVFTRRSTAARLVANSVTTEVWTSPITTPLGIITVQLPASNSFAAHLSVWRGLADAVPDAEGHNATAPLTASASITVTASGATTHANELVVAAVMAKAGNPTSNSFTDDATYTTLTAVTPTGTLALHPGYKTLSATGTPAMTGSDAVTGGFTVQEMTGNLVTFQLAGTAYSLTGGATSDLDGSGGVKVASAKSGGAFSDLDGSGSAATRHALSGGAFSNLDGSGSVTTRSNPSGGAFSDLDGGGSVAVASAKTGGAFTNLDGSGSVLEFFPPDPPVVFCGGRDLTSITITWTDTPGTNPIDHYEVSLDGAPGIVTTGLSYTFKTLPSGTCFDFTVRAVDDHGNASAWSAPVTCCTTIVSVTGVRLGCGLYTVYVLKRGGDTIVAELPFTGLSWSRALDDTSSCTVTIDGLSGAEGAKCCATLRGVTPWEHEIGVYRNGERVWAGPYVSAQLRSTGAELDARDLSIWPFRRIIHHDHAFVNTDLADIFAAYVLDAMSVDNSPGLVVTPTATGIRGKRTVLVSMAKLVGPLLKELDRTGIDWTVIDRAMMVGGTSIVTPSIGMLTDSHFAVEPDVYLDGLSQATDVYTRGAGGGAKGAPILGHAFDTAARAKYGWLEIAPRERLIEDDTSALVSADSRLQLIRDTPAFISQARLSPDAPVEMRSLVPGAVCDVRLTYTCWPVVGLQRLHDVTVTLGKDSAETVDVTFQPIGTNEEPTS